MGSGKRNCHKNFKMLHCATYFKILNVKTYSDTETNNAITEHYFPREFSALFDRNQIRFAKNIHNEHFSGLNIL